MAAVTTMPSTAPARRASTQRVRSSDDVVSGIGRDAEQVGGARPPARIVRHIGLGQVGDHEALVRASRRVGQAERLVQDGAAERLGRHAAHARDQLVQQQRVHVGVHVLGARRRADPGDPPGEVEQVACARRRGAQTPRSRSISSTSRNPLVIERRWRMVSAPPGETSGAELGRWRRTSSSRPKAPRAASTSTAAAMKVFDTETMWNRVRGPMGTRCERLANPTCRRAMTSAPRVTDTATPGSSSGCAVRPSIHSRRRSALSVGIAARFYRRRAPRPTRARA